MSVNTDFNFEDINKDFSLNEEAFARLLKAGEHSATTIEEIYKRSNLTFMKTMAKYTNSIVELIKGLAEDNENLLEEVRLYAKELEAYSEDEVGVSFQ